LAQLFSPGLFFFFSTVLVFKSQLRAQFCPGPPPLFLPGLPQHTTSPPSPVFPFLWGLGATLFCWRGLLEPPTDPPHFFPFWGIFGWIFFPQFHTYFRCLIFICVFREGLFSSEQQQSSVLGPIFSIVNFLYCVEAVVAVAPLPATPPPNLLVTPPLAPRTRKIVLFFRVFFSPGVPRVFIRFSPSYLKTVSILSLRGGEENQVSSCLTFPFRAKPNAFFARYIVL